MVTVKAAGLAGVAPRSAAGYSAWMRAVIYAAILAVAACSPSPKPQESKVPPAPSSPPTRTVRVPGAAAFREVADALANVPRAGGPPWALALFGVPASEPDVTWVDLAIGPKTLRLALVAEGRDVHYLREDARAHNQALVSWTASRRLALTHASDTSESAPVDFGRMATENAAMTGAPREGVLVLLARGDEPASEVFGDLEPAPRAVHYVVLMIGP